MTDESHDELFGCHVFLGAMALVGVGVWLAFVFQH